MISSGLNVVSQPAGAWLLLLTLMHALTVACTVLRLSAYIPMQLTQTVALLLHTQGASLLSGLQLIAAGLLVPCFIVLQVEAAARQAFLQASLTGAESGAAMQGQQTTKWLGSLGGSKQPAAAGDVTDAPSTQGLNVGAARE
jgi:hypothetical protein